MPPVLTLTTDFGTRDAYVAAMKAVMLGLAPDVRMVDVSHAVGAQDVMEAAFVLGQAWPYFPAGSVHLAVVDPGVGTERRAVALRYDDHLFVGPDNGLFALLLDGEAPDALVSLDKPEAWRSPEPSRTFHGRDIFAPVAARLAAGAKLEDVGTPAEKLQPLHWMLPIADEQGVRGYVVHVDRFGNAVTNIEAEVLAEHRAERRLRTYAGGTILDGLVGTYGEVAPGEPLLLVGSSGHLEVAVHNGHAADLLGLRKGDAVQVVFASDRADRRDDAAA